MSGFQIVVCGSIVPDPLQTLEPTTGPTGPSLKNELMLPAVLDPWAGHALYEAAHLASKVPGSKVWLVALGPKAKLQQVMMAVGQKVPFELVAVDGPAGGFLDAHETAAALAEAVKAVPGLDRSRLLLFGGWESASRGAGVTLQVLGERSGSTSPTSSRAWTRSPRAPTARSRSWSGWRVASTRSPSWPDLRRCWGGPPAASPSRATTRRSGWPT
jgi:electron transfer flavoprotein beta subunit